MVFTQSKAKKWLSAQAAPASAPWPCSLTYFPRESQSISGRFVSLVLCQINYLTFQDALEFQLMSDDKATEKVKGCVSKMQLAVWSCYIQSSFDLSDGVHKRCRQIASNLHRRRLAKKNEQCLDSKTQCFLAGKIFSYYECWGRRSFSF